MHPCTREEFAQKFPDWEEWLFSSFICVNDISELELAGTLGAQSGKLFELLLKECEGDDCKSKTDIEENFDKIQATIIISTQSYQMNNYESEPMSLKSKAIFINLNDLA